MTSIAPWLTVVDATEALAFYRVAFGAVDVEKHEADGVVQVAQLFIGGADFWIQHDPDVLPESVDAGSVRMILAVDHPDAVFARAVEAGATAIYPVRDANGWHIGRILDPFGHHWEIGRRLTS